MKNSLQDNPETTRRGGHWLAKLLVPKLILAVIVVALLAAGWLSMKNYYENQNKTTKLGFEDIGEFATQECRSTQVSSTTAAREVFGVQIPFTQSRYIYSYDVVTKAGYDFSAITWDVQDTAITVHMPEPQVLSCELDLDSFQVYYENESAFRHITMEENNQALTSLKQQAEDDAIANGLLDNARDNAEVLLTAFFAQAYDLDEYTLTFE